MHINKFIQDEILSALASIGSNGAMTTEIEKHVSVERHTLVKYLGYMQAQGIVFHKAVGRAKIWFINKAPLQSVLQHREHQSFTEEVLSNMLDHLPIALIIIDQHYTIQYANSVAQDMYGEISGKFFYQCVVGHKNPLKLKKVQDVLDGFKSMTKFSVADIDGRVLSVKVSGITNPDEGISSMLMIEDVTEKQRIAKELEEHKQLLEAEREALNKAAIVTETDLSGVITYVNDQFCSISQYNRDELLGQTHTIVNSGKHSKSFFASMWKTLSSGKVWTGQICNKAKDGSLYWVESAIAPVLDAKGKPIKYLAIRFDITDHKNATK